MICRSFRWLLLVFAILALTTAAPLASFAQDESEQGAGATAAEQGESADSPEPDIRVTTSGVTVHAVNVYAHRLFARLAAKAGLQLVVDDAIKHRKVTVHLSDKTPLEVLDHIVSAYGFSCGCVNGVYMVSEGIPRKPSSYMLSDIRSIPTQYVQASNAKSLLPVFLQDHVKVNYEQNAVVLSAPTDVLEKFEADIRQFDIPAAQIMIEIMVVEFTDWYEAQRDLGIRWQSAGRGTEWGTLSLPPGDANLPERGLGDLVLRGIGDLPNEFRAKLIALEGQRRAKVRAAPRIATVSGRYASFFVGIQRYLRQPIDMPGDEFGGGGGGNYIAAGVRLGISPWTGDGQEIICEVHPEVSTLSALDPVTGLPEKITRTADTMVRVRDGQTIVLGGLRQDEQRRIRSKVPILGDLPLVGALFRSSRTFLAKTDLVIFVTPRVLSSTGHLPEDEERQLKQRFLEE